ncbi:MAG: DUF4364 family protein, partial [Clostridia bacterium]|nr:DUF4364 family protein [Clostridia bacterium]
MIPLSFCPRAVSAPDEVYAYRSAFVPFPAEMLFFPCELWYNRHKSYAVESGPGCRFLSFRAAFCGPYLPNCFAGGVFMQRHGFIKEQKDIKHLILFCLSLLPFAVKESDLLEVVFIDDGFGYFEYSAAFRDLVEARYIAVVDAGPEKEYLITPRGKELLDMLESELRQSVRDRAEAAATSAEEA